MKSSVRSAVWISVVSHLICVSYIVQLKLQAALKGPSHPAPGGFRKTTNGGQYAFKVVNIDGMPKSFICAKLSTASRWHYDYEWLLPFRCVQGRTLIKREVWGRSDIVWLSYSNFLFDGNKSNFVRPPGTRPLTKTQDLLNLASQRPYDYTYQIWRWSDKNCRRSSLKYEAWNGKNCTKIRGNSK